MEFNIEAPEEIAEEVANKLYECMVKAGRFICKIVPLDAEISRHKICTKTYIDRKGTEICSEGDIIAIDDKNVVHNMTKEKDFKLDNLSIKEMKKNCISDNGPLPTYWIH